MTKLLGSRFVTRYAVALGVLLAISVVRAILMLTAPPRDLDASGVIFRIVFDAVFWIVLAVPAVWLADRVRIGRRSWYYAVPFHIAAAIAFMVVNTMVTLTIASRVVAPINLQFAVVLYGQSQVNVLTYFAIVIAMHGLAHTQRSRERERRTAQLELQQAQLEAQLARAQLHALQVQLQPHFLFNALNAVGAFIHSEPDRAERMLTGLGELLRGVLAASREPSHPLNDELALVDRYLAIQEERLGERLQVRKEIADEALDVLVPTLLLQPIVENAVQHGVAAWRAGGRIEIRAWRADHDLEITVRDASGGERRESERGLGVGLTNTQARLAQMYGAAHRFEVRNLADGFEVSVRIPWRTQA